MCNVQKFRKGDLMNLENLKTGERYKYKDLCLAFGFQPATGNTKKKHLTTFEQYLNIKKDGTWFIVTEIYDSPKEREDGRIQTLAQHRGTGRKPSFEYDDELQLMILLYLARRTYAENEETGKRPNVKYNYEVGMSQLFVQSGLCSDFYHDTLCKDGYYLIGSKKQIINGEALYTKTEFKEAFRDFYRHMQNDVRTALNDLRKKKVLEYVEVKSWFDGKEWQICNDMEIQAILEAREDTVDWWNETHRKQLKTSYDLYNAWTLTPQEKDEAFEFMHERIRETMSENYVTHCSSFKIYCSQRAVERQLKEIGYEELLNDKKLIEKKLIQVKEKNLELQLKRTLDKEREKQMLTLNKFYEEQAELREQKKLFGCVKNKPYVPLADDITYNNAKELLKKGIFGINEMEMKRVKKIIDERKNKDSN